jgi:uncharacterized phiE125 gp8 family phage protein
MEANMVTGEAFDPGADALGEAKAYLRVVGSDEDALAARLLRSAGELCEQFTGKVLLAREFSETVAASAMWQRLRCAPVQAITLVEGLRSDGLAAALPAAAYAIDIDARGEGWVRVTAAGEASRVRVSYRAGLAAEWSAAPEALRQGIVRLAAHFYTHRDAADGGAGGGAPPAAVSALWRPWRRLGLRFR